MTGPVLKTLVIRLREVDFDPYVGVYLALHRMFVFLALQSPRTQALECPFEHLKCLSGYLRHLNALIQKYIPN